MTQDPKPDEFTLPTTLAQAILDYLQSRPWKEVAHLIAQILACNPKEDLK